MKKFNIDSQESTVKSKRRSRRRSKGMDVDIDIDISIAIAIDPSINKPACFIHSISLDFAAVRKEKEVKKTRQFKLFQFHSIRLSLLSPPDSPATLYSV